MCSFGMKDTVSESKPLWQIVVFLRTEGTRGALGEILPSKNFTKESTFRGVNPEYMLKIGQYLAKNKLTTFSFWFFKTLWN